jgi:hypothetical protein
LGTPIAIRQKPGIYWLPNSEGLWILGAVRTGSLSSENFTLI